MTNERQPTSGNDFLQFRGQILVLEPTGKWASAIRQSSLGRELRCHVVANVDEIVERAANLPTIAVIAAVPGQVAAIAQKLEGHLSRKNFACWLVVPGASDKGLAGGIDGFFFDSDFALEIQRAGFSGILHSLIELPRWQTLATRFLATAPPVDWTLDERIEQQYPWRPT